MNFFKTLGLGVYYRLRRISKAVKNWKRFGVVIFGALMLAANVLPMQTLRVQAASTDFLRVTLPMGSSTIQVGETEDYTIVQNVKLNGVAVTPDTVKWYVDSNEQITFRDKQNFTYTPTLANTSPGYLIRVIVTVGSLTANSTSRLYVENAPQQDNLTVAISPAGTVSVTINQSVKFTPSVAWNGGAAPSGTQVDWYVNSVKKTTLSPANQYPLPTAVASVFSVYAVARYNTVTSGHSNTTLVNVAATPPPQDFLRVTLPMGSSTIKLGETEDYTIVQNVKLNGVAVNPDTTKWYVDSVEQTSARNNQNFSYTPTSVNLTPGYLIRVIVTKGTLQAESTSRLYVQDADKNLAIDIIPVGTVPDVAINQTIPFTPHVTWNSGPAQAGTTVDWFVNSVKKGTLAYPAQFNFSSAVAGVSSVYAIAHYSGTDSNHSNTTLVEVRGTQPETLTVEIDQLPQTLTLASGTASRPFTFTARHGQNTFIPSVKTWSVTGGGAIDQNGLFITSTTSNAVTVKIEVWDNDAQYAFDILTFNVVENNPTVRHLVRVELAPTPYGPVLSGTAVPYITRGYDQFDVEITSNIVFNWTLINGTIGILAPMQTGYGQYTTLNTYSTVPTGTYFPLSATGVYVDTNGATWTIPSQVAQLSLTQMIIADVLKYVTAVANPTSIFVGGEISTLTAQAYGDTGPLTSGVSYVWSKVGGPTNFISGIYNQSVQIMSDTNQGIAVYQVTASYPGDSQSEVAQVQVAVNPRTSHTLTVNITPDPVYGGPSTDQPVHATVLYDGVDVTYLSFIDWTMVNGNAGYLSYENQANATVRTSNLLNTYPSALQVYATYNGLPATDTATVVITSQPAPVYWIDWTLQGVIEDGSVPSEGDIIYYKLYVMNNRSNTVNGVRVNVDVPTYTIFVSAESLVDHPNIYGRTITWDAGTLTPGESKSMVFKVSINEGLPKRGVSITAYGRVTANEIVGFNINSNTIRVQGTGPTPGPTPGPLPSTGTDAIVLGLLAVVSLGLSVLTYRWMSRRMASKI